MTLQRIERVTVENWRSWQGERDLEGLGSGVVVLSGPNAIGKSGLWEAIVHGLLDRHWGTHTDRLRPVGTSRVIPRVAIEFTAGGDRYRIEKHFGGAGQRDKATFSKEAGGQWGIVDQGEEAFRLCREAVLGQGDSAPARGGVGYALRDSLMQVLIPEQGSLTQAAPTPEAVRIAVTDQEAAHAATRLGLVLERVTREADAVWVGQRDRPKKNTDWQVRTARLAQVDEEMAPLLERAARIEEHVARLAAAEEELAGLGDATAREQDADDLRTAASEHRKRREAARKAFDAAAALAKEAEDLHAARGVLIEGLASAERELETATRDLAAAQEAKARAEGEHRTAVDDRAGHAVDLERYRAWIAFAARDVDLEELRARRHGLKERLARLDESREVLLATEAEKAALRLPTDAEHGDLERLGQAVVETKARLEAKAWTVSGQVPPGLSLAIDGHDVVAGGPVDATAAREVSLEAGAGDGLRMSAPAEDADAALEAERALAEALRRFDVATLQELTERVRHAKTTLDARILKASERIDAALGTGTRDDLLKEELALAQAVAAKASMGTPAFDRPDGEPTTWVAYVGLLEKEHASAQESVEASRAARDVTAERAASKEREHTSAETHAATARSDLEGHRTEHGSDDELVRRTVAEGSARDGAEAAWRLLDEAREMAEEAKETRAQALTDGFREAAEKKQEVKNLETRIAALREADPEGRLVELEAERAKLLPAIARARTHGEALRLLEATLHAEKDELTAAVSGPLQGKIAPWLRYLLQDASEVSVGEDGVPLSITTPTGQEVPYADQSYGTREQVSVLYRLAVADLVAEEAGSGVCLMLDDPFGHTDRGRRERMLEILQAQAEKRGHQILVFTCRPEDFEGIGTHHPIP